MRSYRFKIFGHDYEARVVRKTEGEMVITVNGVQYKAHLEQRTDRKKAKPIPKLVRPEVVSTESTKISASPDEPKGMGVVKAPMPGLVIKVNVKPGDQVNSGQAILIIEAMKMQNDLPATVTGTVKSVSVKEGETVVEGQELVVIEES